MMVNEWPKGSGEIRMTSLRFHWNDANSKRNHSEESLTVEVSELYVDLSRFLI